MKISLIEKAAVGLSRTYRVQPRISFKRAVLCNLEPRRHSRENLAQKNENSNSCVEARANLLRRDYTGSER